MEDVTKDLEEPIEDNGVPAEVINKTPEEIEKEILEGFKKDEITDPEVEIETEVKTEVKDEEKKDEPAYVYHPAWDTIKAEYEEQNGAGTFKMPEGITKETEGKMLLDFLTENLETGIKDTEIPDVAKEIIELSKKGAFDEAEWFRQRQYRQDIEKMSADDVLFNAYKNEYGKTAEKEDGYTDEEIKEFLSKKTKLEKDIEAKQIKEAYKAQIAEQQNKTKEYVEAQLAKQIETDNINKVKIAEQLITANKNKSEYLGVPFSKAEAEEYNKFFKEAVKIDPKTGTSKLYDLIQSDETLYELGAILWKGGSKTIKEKIAQAKNSAKEEIEGKLGTKADIKAGSINEQQPQLVDWKKFKGEE